MKKFNILLAIIIFPLMLSAQIDSMALKTPEGITNRMLELISMEQGEEGSWDEYRNLFLPTAQKISVRRSDAPMSKQLRVMNLEEFVRYVGPLYSRDGFEEIVIGQTINEYNGIAQVFQTFQCKNLIGTYEKRGVNSFQLVYINDRWWIASTTFTNETEDNPLPNEFIDEAYR